MHILQGQVSGEGRRIAVAVSRFNELVSGRLLEGALAMLAQHGVRDDAITVAWAPGAFELPLAALLLAESGRYDAVVALGAVIRGGTPHFEYVCDQSARGLLQAGLQTRVPVAFGVLTCDTLDQALERAGGLGDNKGADAVVAALEMVALKQRIASG